ncbi:MAG: hypothetical protein AAF827_19195 [Cyanobacteria bacterium P01_D01_bin.6]
MLDAVVEHPVEAVLSIPFLIMGLSHILQPAMWQDFFNSLHAMGARGVIWRTFALELWPAAIIVAFHQEWAWPGLILTLYGHVLMTKIGIGLIAPEIGLKSLAMAQTHGRKGFVFAGIGLCILSLQCLLRLIL